MEQLFMGQTALFLNTCSKLKLNLVKKYPRVFVDTHAPSALNLQDMIH